MALFSGMSGKPASTPMGPKQTSPGMGTTGITGTVPQPKIEGQSRGGLMGWLEDMRGEGNTAERLNMFGAQLQDIWGGGDRAESLMEQQALAQQQQAAAQQRAEINKMSQTLNMSPRDRLLFNANPDAYFRMLGDRDNDERDAASRMNQVGYINTSQGVYRTGPDPGWQEQFPDEPDVDFGWRQTPDGGLEYIPGGPADPAYLGRRASSTRAPARPRAASRSSAAPRAPVNPAEVRWD